MADEREDGWLDGARKQFKIELTKKAILGFITLGASLAAIAGLGLWYFLKPNIDTYIADVAGSVLVGAVVAFDIDGCPPGEKWVRFDAAHARVIVGAGRSNDPTINEKPFRDRGGRETTVLAERHIPRHQHDTHIAFAARPSQWGTTNYIVPDSVIGTDHQAATVAKSGFYGTENPDPIPTLPPYIALTYCKRVK